MRELLEKIDAADGFILFCPASNSHANALMKTFDERCVWTLGRSLAAAVREDRA